MAIKFNKDIPLGAIVTSKKGKKYVVLADDTSTRGLFTDKGTWLRFDGDGLDFGKGGDGAIDTIQAFDTLPPLDAMSEGLKYMYTGRTACAHMETIYRSEPAEVTAARNALNELAARKAADDRKAADLRRKAAAYGYNI